MGEDTLAFLVTSWLNSTLHKLVLLPKMLDLLKAQGISVLQVCCQRLKAICHVGSGGHRLEAVRVGWCDYRFCSFEEVSCQYGKAEDC